MLTLDSGAQGTLVRDVELLQHQHSISQVYKGFDGHDTTATIGGMCVGMAKSTTNKRVMVESGMSGHISSSAAPMTDNLVSTVAMTSLGYQFWFGECPFMVTPDGDEILLYQKTNGYLCVKVTPMTGEQVSQLMSPPKLIGWVTNDIDLWHERCCHLSEEAIFKSAKEGLVRGIPKLCRHRKNGTEPICLACGLGKSCRHHVGPNVHRDKEKMEMVKEGRYASERDVRDDPYQELEQ